MKKIFFVLLFVFVCSFNIIAQTNYPVNLILTGSGRYSLKLEDYQNTTTMIHLVAVVSDITINNKPVKFQMSITNGTKKFTTRLNNIRNFYIDGGTTLSFTGVDLSQYFDKNNINFNGYEYNNIGSLPDGNNLLKICLIDVTTGKQISNVASLPLHAIIAKAPELREPMNNSVFENNSSSSIINFRWFEPTKNVPLPSFRFQLFECFNNNVSLYTYAESTKPIAEVVVNGSETLTFDANTVNMKFGQKYVWRVIAFDESGLQTFVNDGKSEVFAFQYKNPPLPITGLACKVVNNEFRFTWDGSPNTKYEFQYADSAATSFSNDPSVINENKYTLKSAKDDYTIKARVRGIYYNDENRKSEWSDLCYARIPKKKERNYECGKIFPDREISNQELKTEFEEGEIIESKNGDTRFEMINVTQNQNGVLSGAFYMIMDCWNEAKILCNFTDTKINTDNIMLEGEYVNEVLPDYVADPEAIRKFVAETWLLGNSALTSTVIRDTLDIDQDFDYMYVDSTGRLMAALVNNDGTITSTEVVTSRSPEQCMVTDGKGDTLVINSHGEPMGVDEYRASNGNRAMLNDYHRKLDSTANFQLNFLPSDKQVYAFDYLGSGDHGIFANNEYYPKSGSYTFRYKSVKTSQTDYVKVDFSTYRGGDKENIVFKDRYGIKLKLIDDNTLAFTASNKPDTNYIYAYDKDGVRIGKLMVYTYNQKIHNVFLVPVKSNGTQNVNLPNVEEVSRAVNKTFNQSVTSFKFQIVDPVIIPDLTTFTHGGSKWTSVFNDDQKKVLEAYDDKMNDNDFYLFFVDNVLDKFDSFGTSVAGYMPRGYNCGFIYDGGSPRTIAHELGHGVGNLEHAFEKSNTSGKTKNLMDYSDGEELYHFQWNEIQDPSRVWMKWSKDESEGENQIGDDYVCTMKFINEFCYAYLNNKPLTYEADGFPYLGHSCNLTITNNKCVHINIKVLQPFKNEVPKSIDLSDSYLKNHIDFVCDEGDEKSNVVFDYLINNYKERINSNIKNLNNSKLNAKNILDTLAIIPYAEYFNIENNTRISILTKLAKATTLTMDYIGCVDDELIVINLIEQTPKTDTDISKLFDELSYVIDDNNLLVSLANHIEGQNYCIFLSSLYNLSNIKYFELVKKLSDNSNIKSSIILAMLSKLLKTDYENIQIRDRINLLKKISTSSITESYFSCIDEEQVVINLFDRIKEEQKCDFITTLIKECDMCDKILNSVDDAIFSFIGNDNWTKLQTQINKLKNDCFETFENMDFSERINSIRNNSCPAPITDNQIQNLKLLFNTTPVDYKKKLLDIIFIYYLNYPEEISNIVQKLLNTTYENNLEDQDNLKIISYLESINKESHSSLETYQGMLIANLISKVKPNDIISFSTKTNFSLVKKAILSLSNCDNYNYYYNLIIKQLDYKAKIILLQWLSDKTHISKSEEYFIIDVLSSIQIKDEIESLFQELQQNQLIENIISHYHDININNFFNKLHNLSSNKYMELIDNFANRQKPETSNMIALLSILSEQEYSNIDIEKRKRILTLCSVHNLSGNIFSYIDQEKVVINLIKNTPETDYNSLFSALQQNNLMQNLVYHIDGANYINFILQLFSVFSKCEYTKFPNLETSSYNLGGERYFLWNKSGYKSTYNQNKICFFNDKTKVFINPFDYVRVNFVEPPNFMEEYKETELVIPAFFFELICNTNRNLSNIEFVSNVVDAISIAVAVFSVGTATGASIAFSGSVRGGLIVLKTASKKAVVSALKQAVNSTLKKICNNYIKTAGKELTKDMLFDFACQYIANWFKQLKEYGDYYDEIWVDALLKYDFTSFVGDEFAKASSLNNQKIETALKCVKELMIKGVRDDSFEQGGFNCLVEVGLYWLHKGHKKYILPQFTQKEIIKLEKIFKTLNFERLIEGSLSNYLKF